MKDDFIESYAGPFLEFYFKLLIFVFVRLLTRIAVQQKRSQRNPPKLEIAWISGVCVFATMFVSAFVSAGITSQIDARHFIQTFLYLSVPVLIGAVEGLSTSEKLPPSN